MRPLKLIGFVTLVMICSSVRAEEPLSVENLANKLLGIPTEKLTRDSLPKRKEQEVLAVLRKRHEYSELFRLNDQPAINEFIEQYRQERGFGPSFKQGLVRSKAPFILDELAPSLYVGPDFERRRTKDGEYSDQGCTMTTAAAMSAIIAEAPEFSEAVRKSVGAGVHPQTMRAWWEENQQALREERYADVKPINPNSSVPLPASPQLPPRHPHRAGRCQTQRGACAFVPEPVAVRSPAPATPGGVSYSCTHFCSQSRADASPLAALGRSRRPARHCHRLAFPSLEGNEGLTPAELRARASRCRTGRS